MKLLHLIAVGLLVAAAPLPAFAQTPATARIEGRVVDADTREPVAGVVVHVEDPRRHEVTHDDGSFHLAQLPAGRFTLLFERVGYATRSVDVAVTLGETARLDVAMTEAPVELEGLVVTATVGVRSADDALRPTSVVAGADLQRQLDATLAGTLESEAGVAVGSMGPAPARPVIRGLGGDRVLILEDGQRVGDVSASSPDHAVAFDPITAERIEVVRGPAALFYGSNALGGVVNVITEDIPSTLPDRLQGSATVQGRSAADGLAGEGSLVAPFGAVAVNAGVAYRSADDLRTPLGPIDNTSTSTLDGSLGAAWVGDWGHTGAALRYYATEYGVPEHGEQEEGAGEGHAHDVTVEMDRLALHGQVRWTRQAGWLDHLELNAKGTRLDQREIEGGGEIGTRIGLNTAMAELVGRHSAAGIFDRGALGARVQRGDYDADREGGSPLRVQEWDAAIYALEELEAGPIQLQVGGRFDFARREPLRAPTSIEGAPVRAREYSNVAGSVSLLYGLAESLSVGTSFTRAFRTPSTDELYSDGAHLASYTFEVGNPDLDAEIGHGVDVFVRVDRPSLRGEVAAFWNRIDDFVQPANTGAIDPESDLFIYQASNRKAGFRGAEASLRWSPLESVAVDGSVSYVRAQDLRTDAPLPLIPPLQADLSLRYEQPSWFAELGWEGAARQDRLPPRPDLPASAVGWCDETAQAAGCVQATGEFLPTPGYGVWSGGVGLRWFAWGVLSSVTLSVENATDEVYRNHLSRIKELMPEQGRSVNLVYRVSF